MSKRNAAQQAEKIRHVEVGDSDVASRAAHHARVPLCGQRESVRGDLHRLPYTCTRAAGHAEGGTSRGGTRHVAAIAQSGFVVLAVWP